MEPLANRYLSIGVAVDIIVAIFQAVCSVPGPRPKSSERFHIVNTVDICAWVLSREMVHPTSIGPSCGGPPNVPVKVLSKIDIQIEIGQNSG